MKSVLRFLGKRMPASAEVRAVFSVVVFAVYSWSIRGFLFNTSSFLMYHSLSFIAAVFFYMMAFALLECVLVTGFLVIVSMILPSGWLRQGFAYKGFLVILVTAIGMIEYQNYYTIDFVGNMMHNSYSFLQPILIGLLISIAALGGLLVLFGRVERLQKLLVALVERFKIFNYVYLPLGLLGFVVVLVRNLF